MSQADDFLSFSAFMIGIPFQPPLPSIANLDPTLAQTYCTNLINPANASVVPPGGTAPDPNWAITPDKMTAFLAVWRGIAAQPRNNWPGLFQSQIQANASWWPLAQQIAMAWYTGVCANVPRSAALYEQTLVWVLAQAHPMGVPLAFGYWQYAPPGANQ